jgi:hypothetical protein
MLQELASINEELKSAEVVARTPDAVVRVGAIDHAPELAESIRQQRNRTLDETTATWYRSWFPLVEDADGRHFWNQVDDVKDHPPAPWI